MCETCRKADLSRRGLLTGAVALAVAATPLLALAAETASGADEVVLPGEALQRLEEGNARYVAGISRNRDYSVDRAARALGQRPFASIVSCSDSRVAPELLFDQGPGDLFIIRVAGNFVNEDGLASLEYGALVLGSQLVMVLGHSGCGAVKAAIDVVTDDVALPGHLPSLTNAIGPAVEAAMAAKPADLLAAATIENVRQNVAYLKTAYPILAEKVAAGTVEVVGAIYDVATGTVTPV